MSQEDYTPETNFSAKNRVDPVDVDIELQNIATALLSTQLALSAILRDDNKLKDALVKPFQLSAETLKLMQSNINPLGEWTASTDYKVLDLVESDGNSYLCFTPHTSGATFVDDRANGYWMAYSYSLELAPGVLLGEAAFREIGTAAGNVPSTAIADARYLRQGQGKRITETGVDAIIETPEGGQSKATGNKIGRIKVQLPQAIMDASMRFVVDLVTFGDASNAPQMMRLVVTGEQSTADGKWKNCRAVITEGGKEALATGLKVTYGTDLGKACIWLGEGTTKWINPVVSVRAVQLFKGVTSNYSEGWQIAFVSGLDAVHLTQDALLEYTNPIKKVTSLTPNVTVSDDGKGNLTLNATALGGGDVFRSGDNAFTGDNTFTGDNAFTGDNRFTTDLSVMGVPVLTTQATRPLLNRNPIATQPTGLYDWFIGLAYSPSLDIIVGVADRGNQLMWSEDKGDTWSLSTDPGTGVRRGQLVWAEFANKFYMGFGESTDGKAFTDNTPAGDPDDISTFQTGLSESKGILLGMNPDGEVFYTEGGAWGKATFDVEPDSNFIRSSDGVIYSEHAGIFMVIEYNALIFNDIVVAYTSLDGKSFTRQVPFTVQRLSSSSWSSSFIYNANIKKFQLWVRDYNAISGEYHHYVIESENGSSWEVVDRGIAGDSPVDFTLTISSIPYLGLNLYLNTYGRSTFDGRSFSELGHSVNNVLYVKEANKVFMDVAGPKGLAYIDY